MRHVSRRSFLGSAGAICAGSAFGAAAEGSEGAQNTEVRSMKRQKNSGGLAKDIQELVDKTPLVDTHEHLWEESLRIKSMTEETPVPAADFGILFCHYADSDVQVAGMPPQEFQKITARDVSPQDKWRLLAPYYERCRHTGYLQCVRESVRALYGEDDLCKENVDRVSEKLAAQVKPRYYYRVLRDVANIEYSQVNGLQSPIFCDTEYPDLLAQDIWTIRMSTDLDLECLRTTTKRDIVDLAQLHGAIDACFDEFAPRAIATKNQCAYNRRLNFADVPDVDSAPIFARFATDPKSLSDDENKALQDHLMHYCIRRATDHGLPVKLHTGYYAGYGGMPLERVRQNAGDLCPLLRDHAATKFVLMHIDYPYQDEAIALAKHYPNAYIDMCWAWIINPAACVRFLKEFLMAAPANKILTFGGDYLSVEMVPGHAAIARKGIAQAITELTQEGWVEESDLPALVDRIMRGNAHELFDHERALRNAKKAPSE